MMAMCVGAFLLLAVVIRGAYTQGWSLHCCISDSLKLVVQPSDNDLLRRLKPNYPYFEHYC